MSGRDRRRRVAVTAADASAEGFVRRVRAARPDLIDDDDGVAARVVSAAPWSDDGRSLVLLVDPPPDVFRQHVVGAASESLVIGRWSAHPVLDDPMVTEAVLEGAQWIELVGAIDDPDRLAAAELDVLAVIEELLGPVGGYLRTGEGSRSRLGRVRLRDRPEVVVTAAVMVGRSPAGGMLQITASSRAAVLRVSVPPSASSAPASVSIDSADGCRSAPARYGSAECVAFELVVERISDDSQAVPGILSWMRRERLSGFLASDG